MEQVINTLQSVLDRLNWQKEMKIQNTDFEYAKQLEKAIEILKNHSNDEQKQTKE